MSAIPGNLKHSKTMSDHTKCPHCNGRGKNPVTGIYAETLAKLRQLCKTQGFVVANRDAELFNCKATALNNRLAWAEEHGFAKSERFGKQRRFKAI